MPDFMQQDVKVPGLGKEKKWVIYGVGGAAGAYVGWKWWQARNAAAAAPPADTGTYSTDLSGMGDSATGGPLDVTGNTGDTTTDGTTSGAINTNADWTQQAVELLSEAGYDASTVYAALGAFLAGQSLTTDQATIARAALAAAGQPPIGGPFSVKEQATTGGTSLPAPQNLASDTQTSSSVHLVWEPVDGAVGYNIYRSDTGGTVDGVGTSNSGTVAGLQGNKSYTFSVAARAANGQVGARSSSVTVKTKAVSLTPPTGLKASAISRTGFTVTCNPVPGATYYHWYLSGAATTSTDAPMNVFTGRKPNTTYHVTVAADTTTQSPSKQSASLTVKTSK